MLTHIFRFPLVLLSFAAGALGAAPLDEPIKPIPQSIKVDPAKVALGKVLFVDKRLSSDNSVSCQSCHLFEKGGAHPSKRPTGAAGKQHVLNSPSVFNVAFGFKQLWSGGVDDVESVIERVVTSPRVFGSNWEQVLNKLSQDATLVDRFNRTFKDGLTRANVTQAIAEYNRALITPNARFDKYLLGDIQAINDDEKAGYALFKKLGCIACHQGVNVGGNMYQPFGVMGDYFKARGNIEEADFGLYNFTKRESDRHTFKVPSLRNVALTAPYFHDGSAATLEEAVEVMFRYQLGRPAAKQDRDLIVKFLGTLNGELSPALK